MVLGKQLLYVRFATREKKSFQFWNHLMYNFSSDHKRKHPMAWFLANRLFKLIITVTEVQKKKSYFADQFERRCVPLPWYVHTNENYVKSHAQQHTQAQSAKLFSGC